ncbi:MAG: diguanylate cyclase [Deltaproteobacteria bacterium]|nr:diguanylate cyclase [Deltaproteobacteria bacterium]
MSPAEKKEIVLIGLPETDHPLFLGALEDFSVRFFATWGEAAKIVGNESEPELLFIDHPKDKPPLELLRHLKTISLKTPVILILNEGDEKTAVSAAAQGVSDYLVRGELIPAIIRMAVTRAIEHRKWETLFHAAGSLKDPQTGLFNKAYLETRMSEEVKRSERYSFPLTMVLFTLEQFDFITEKYGKETVDALMGELSGHLSKDLRGSDLLARIAENRFALLLPHTSVNTALVAWERLLQTVSEHPFRLKGDNFYISLKGVLTPLNHEVETIDALLAKMESCMEENASSEDSLRLFLEP